MYWCARDLAKDWHVVGNHHFILLIGDNIVFKPEDTNNEKGVVFLTLGGFDSPDKLVGRLNNSADVESVREGINPKKYVSSLVPDYDIEAKKVNIPRGLTLSKFLARSFAYYETYVENSCAWPTYDSTSLNCASWANSLLAALGVPEEERESMGDFFGFDVAQNKEIDLDLFKKKVC